MIQDLKTKLGIYSYELENNQKIVRKANEPIKLYNPFDYYNKDSFQSMHIQFASIDYNDPKKILDFINKYGFLGLDIRDRYINIEIDLTYLQVEFYKMFTSDKAFTISDLENFLYKVNDAVKMFVKVQDKVSYKDIYEERLEDISYEILKYRTLLKLYQQMDSATSEELYQLLYNVSDCYQRHFVEERYKEHPEKLKSASINFIRDTINKEIGQVNPILILNTTSNCIFESQWNVKTLISAMYTMLYLDLVQGRHIKRCKNSTCHNFFEVYGIDNRKEFCSTKCAQAYASREYRRRKREGDVKNGINRKTRRKLL